jgi:hypothetical protein
MNPTLSLAYIRDVLQVHEVYLQSLSFVDVSMNLESKYAGFFTGALAHASVFSGPLVAASTFVNMVPEVCAAKVLDLLQYNLEHNPLYCVYKAVMEHSGDGGPIQSAFPLLPASTVEGILGRARERGVVYSDAQVVDTGKAVMNLLVDFVQPVFNVGHQYSVNGLVLRASDAIEGANVLVSPECSTTGGASISLEVAMFPFLFPHGRGYLSSGDKLVKYLKWRMQGFCSVFTLCKV